LKELLLNLAVLVGILGLSAIVTGWFARTMSLTVVMAPTGMRPSGIPAAENTRTCDGPPTMSST